MQRMTEHFNRIYEFMSFAGQALPPSPCIPDEQTRELRARLILEEALETIKGLGFSVAIKVDEDAWQDEVVNIDDQSIGNGEIDFEPDFYPDLVEIADGCADLSVVTIGTLIACGIEDGPLLEAVDNANLRKFGPGSYRRDDGKWIKPPDFVEADIEQVLNDQTGDE